MNKKELLKEQLEAHKRVKEQLTTKCDKCGEEFPFDEIKDVGHKLCSFHYSELLYVISKYFRGELRK